MTRMETVRWWHQPLSQRYQQYLRRLLLDLLMVPAAFYVAAFLFADGRITAVSLLPLHRLILPVTFVFVAVNAWFGMYRRMWAYAGFWEVWLVVATAVMATGIVLAINSLLPPPHHLHSGLIVLGGLCAALLSSVVKYRRQMTLLLMQTWKRPLTAVPERVLIVGSGQVANQLGEWLHTARDTRYHIVGCVRDDQACQGMNINGMDVLGTTADIPGLVKRHRIDIIVLVQPQTDRKAMWALITLCQQTDAQIKVLPDVADMMDVHYRSPLTLRELRVEDILNRQPLPDDAARCQELLQDQVVLVTGAAGSIGSELCRQILTFGPRQLLALDNNETGLFDLGLALGHQGAEAPVFLMADVTDRHKLAAIFSRYRPAIVFHAAAYKHVPLVELNPDEALRVNIRGTLALADIASRYNAARFVFISTDKAVNPRGVMGASKYIGELAMRALDAERETVFTAVRFGNVIGSRGSVLPVFTRQIHQGGPVTVTHPEMRRFFMSIPEAVSLVLHAAAFSRGGEVFMLDMGDEVRILDLAERMIRLRGLRVHKDVAIEFIGMRPGEKLQEHLSYHSESRLPTPHPRIYALAAENLPLSFVELVTAVDELATCLDASRDMEQLRHGIFRVAAHRFTDQQPTPVARPPQVETAVSTLAMEK